jgi:hypothetical protein
MPHFYFGGWTHAEAVWSHKSACLKERYYVPTCPPPDSNICMLAVFMQPYFLGGRQILIPNFILATASRIKSRDMATPRGVAQGQ